MNINIFVNGFSLHAIIRSCAMINTWRQGTEQVLISNKNKKRKPQFNKFKQ
jgi:hypothetical protein